MSNPLK